MRYDDEEKVSRYPLEWPAGWRRAANRVYSAFRSKSSGSLRPLTVYQAIARLEDELRRLKARNVTISTNVRLRQDGIPRSDEAEPRDPGAAVYFSFRGKATVFACDRYTRVADNIAAIAAHVEALRAIERYGVGSLDQALAGYKALPADTAADWRKVLGFVAGPVTSADVQRAFKERSLLCHPDRFPGDSGKEAEWYQLQRARDYALAEIAG